MRQRILGLTMAMLMVTQPVAADGNQPVRTNWKGMQEQVSRQKLTNRGARIVLKSGDEIKARILRVEENGLAVASTSATQKWAAGKGESLVPREVVSSVRFSGRVGKSAAIGTLAGLGAGAAVAVAVASADEECEAASCAAAFLLVPVAAVGGYFLGRAAQKPAPAFVIQE